MAKQNPYIKDLFKILGKKEIDDTALTVRELSEQTGESFSNMGHKIMLKVKNGEIEQVWKKSGVRLVRAYRPARKK